MQNNLQTKLRNDCKASLSFQGEAVIPEKYSADVLSLGQVTLALKGTASGIPPANHKIFVLQILVK